MNKFLQLESLKRQIINQERQGLRRLVELLSKLPEDLNYRFQGHSYQLIAPRDERVVWQGLTVDRGMYDALDHERINTILATVCIVKALEKEIAEIIDDN